MEGAGGVCVRAESAGSCANRRGSSVNGVNEEWEQTKCAEMREVPPHCIGGYSVSPPPSHIDIEPCTRQAALHSDALYLALLAIFPTAIDTKHFPFAPPCTYMHILLLSHSPCHTPILTDKHMHTFLACPRSICFALSPHKVCSPLFSPSTFPRGGSTL